MRLSAESLTVLRREAIARQVSVNRLIQAAVDDWIDNYSVKS